MTHTTWTTTKIDATLGELAHRTAPSAERCAVVDAFVRARIEERFGSAIWSKTFAADRAVVHIAPRTLQGMMDVLRGIVLQPAFSVASLVLLVAGALAVRTFDGGAGRTEIARTPMTSSAVVLEVAPLQEGSGTVMSVFATESIARAAQPVVAPAVSRNARASATTINPVPGVFSTWGTSVFSDDEALTRPWDGKYVFSS